MSNDVPIISTEERQNIQHMLDHIDQYTFNEMVDLSLIKTTSYCRPVSEYRINQLIRQGFDVRKMGTLKTSLQTDGSHNILDGNHRVEAARKLGLTALPSQVFIDLTFGEEAELFEAFNTVNRPTAMDRFRSKLARQQPEALEIRDILESVGMRIAMNGPAVGAVAAIGAVERVHTDLGAKGLEEIVGILYKAWGNQRRAWITTMFDGMRLFWARYRTEVKQAQLIARLSAIAPERILAEAGLGVVQESPGTRVGKTILLRYNRGRNPDQRLEDWTQNPGPNKSFYEEGASDRVKGATFSRMKMPKHKPEEPAF